MSLHIAPHEVPDVEQCIQRHKRSESPALSAAAHGHVACLRALCSADAAAVHSRSSGFAPLYEAARKGHVDCVQLLLDMGADDEGASNDERETALSAAAGSGHVECVRLLMENGARHYKHALQQAVVRNKLNCARVLLEHGADPNVVLTTHTFGTTHRRRPLYDAVSRGSQLTQLLLEFGADVNALCDIEKLRTPLHEAALRSSGDCVQILLRHGAHLDAVDTDGRTPLHDAAADCSADKVAALLRWGSCVDARNIAGATTFAEAADGGSPGPWKWSLVAGCARVLRVLHRLDVDEVT